MLSFKLPDSVKTLLLELFELYVEDGLQFIWKYCIQAIRQVDISKVCTLCSLMEALLLGKDGPDFNMVLGSDAIPLNCYQGLDKYDR